MKQLILLAGAILFASVAYAQPLPDHLQCHKVKDTQKFKEAQVTLDAIQLAFQMPENCTIKGKGREFCVPVTKTVVDSDAPGSQIGPGQDLSLNDYVCYKMKCPKTTHADELVTDQFGVRVLEKIKAPKRICVPAVKGTPPTTIPCVPDCTGLQCGDDGCNGSCGDCAAGEICNANGLCECVPDCTGLQCGDDGCNGSCGDCAAGEICNANGLCECVPDCAGLQCGDDGCGGSCGTCQQGEICVGGVCELDCAPDTNCSGVCVDLSSDPAHCGACDAACPPSYNCISGNCECTPPTITDVAPTTACPGDTVQVTGTDFGVNTAVIWDGAPVTTTFVDSTQLEFSVPVAAAPGLYDVTVSSGVGCEDTLFDAAAIPDVFSDPNNCGGCGIVCAPVQSCIAGQCKLQNGQVCSASSQCVSAFCSDSVCCNTACDGSCEACVVSKTGGVDGTCSFISNGADPDEECVDQGPASCGFTGVCNGLGACAFYPSGTACTATGGICDGAGTCLP